MLKHRFYLRSSKDNPTSLYFLGNAWGKNFKVYLNILINPDHWDKRDKLIKDTPEEPRRMIYNKEIRMFKRRIDDANEKFYSFKNLDHLIDYLKGVNTNYEKTFLDYVKDTYVKRVPNDTGVYKNLKNYAQKGKEVSWASVQKKHFADGFTTYLERKDYSVNYIGKHFKVIKIVLNEAYQNEILDHVNTSFLKVVTEDVDTIYLSDEELRIIHEKPFSGYLEDAKDRFLIGCYTGMRFNDFIRLNPDKDIKDGLIKIRTGRGTGNKSTNIVIPIHPIVKEILDKRNNKLPLSISNQKMNDYIKDVAKAAEINSEVSMYRTKGGKTTKESFPKWKLVSTHTARRSFATNAFKAGISTLLIMKITGHKTEKAFMRYIRITAEEAAIQMQKSSFFQ